MPEQLCSIGVGVGAGLELVLGRRRGGEERADGVELLGQREVRRARDRDLAVVELGARAHERQRLDAASPTSGGSVRSRGSPASATISPSRTATA